MAFQIRNEIGDAIPINKIDEIVAKIWGNPVMDKTYAVPISRDKFPKGLEGSFSFSTQTNWFDSIGWVISSEPVKNWLDVKSGLIKIHLDYILKDENPSKKFESVLNYLSPYFKVIDEFEKKGYKPVHLN